MAVALAAGFFLGGPATAAETEVKRVVVALYDSKENVAAHRTLVHTVAAMPLNHLGLVVRLYDLRKGLPPESEMRQARGVLTWFSSAAIDDGAAYVRWAVAQLDAGRRFVVLGHPGVDRNALRSRAERSLFDRFLNQIGATWHDAWSARTYDSSVAKADPRFFPFERSLPPLFPSYPIVSPAGPNVRSLLVLRERTSGRTSHVALVGARGAFIAPDFALSRRVYNGGERRNWLVNPFKFFRLAFATTDVPKPDTTTISGRRMYYSHIDGDAWHNISSVEEYLGKRVVSAEVVYDKVMRAFPDMPVTVAPVTADLDPAWYGGKEAIALARKIFALPNVEAGTHTHSHPFAWGFFRKYDPAREVPFLKRYPPRRRHSLNDSVWRPSDDERARADRIAKDARTALSDKYARPRAYAVTRFDIADEVTGSIAFLEKHVLPPGKKVRVIQWSGDTLVFPEALALARKAGVRNINGGDPRMDGAYNSYAWVSGLGRRVGDGWQVYTSAANENIYTDGWRNRFSGFRLVVETMRNTETPIRIKPINVYYHFYTAERSDALNALLGAIRYARGQNIAPVTASKFAAIVEGFMSARIVRLGAGRWRIEERDRLETIRFDKAAFRAVDFARSKGVVGQRHFQGSLYVALDASVAAPVIALKPISATDGPPPATKPYLVESRWVVHSVAYSDTSFRYDARGFGNGVFRWRVPAPGRYHIVARTRAGEVKTLAATVGDDHILAFTVETMDAKPRLFVVTHQGAS